MNSNQLQNKKHNGIISFYKFCFSIMIVIFHARIFAIDKYRVLFSKGYIAVEFFFLVSGFLMAKTAFAKKDSENYNQLGQETFYFILKKIKNFFPYILFAGIIGIIVQNIYMDMNIYKNVTSIWDFLFVNMSGLRTNNVIGQTWYISAMLISMIFLYPMIRKHKYNFIYIVAPLIVILGFGFLNHQYVNLRGPDKWIGIAYKGLVRGFIELTFGAILFVICERIKKIEFNLLGKSILTFIEFLGFFSIFLISQFSVKSYYDYVEVLILAISITLAFSEKTLEFNLMSNKFSLWLEKISLPIFLLHIPVRDFMINSIIFENVTYKYKIISILVITFVLSLICMYLIQFLKSKNYFWDKIKKLIIVSNQ